MKTLKEAQLAKPLALNLLQDQLNINGIGIFGNPQEGYGLSVHLKSEAPKELDLPSHIQGVPVQYRFVGQVHLS